MERIWREVFEKRYSVVFFLLFFMIVYAVLGYLTSLFQTDELIANSLSEKLSQKQINQIVESIQNKGIFRYFISSLYFPFVALIISAVVYLGIYFLSLKINYFDVFKIAVISESVILLQDGMKLLWFYYFNSPKSLIEIKNFIPLSLQNIFRFETLLNWQISLFSLSLFDVLLMLLLASGLEFRLKIISFERAFIIVLSTYGLALLLYLAINIAIMSNF